MGPQDTFKKFSAQELYCPRCKRATPVREHLLLVLPGTGQVYDLRCARCGEPVGKRTEEDEGETPGGLVIP